MLTELVGYLFLAALSIHQSAGYANRLALIVRVNQFSSFIQSDFSFDVSFSHIYEIRRRLQPIYSLQSDSRLPVLGAFLLRRFSLSKYSSKDANSLILSLFIDVMLDI